MIDAVHRALWLWIAVASLGCSDRKREQAAAGSAASATAVANDAAVPAVKARARPPISITEVSAAVAPDADRDGPFTALEVQFTAGAEDAIDSADAEIAITASCPMPDRWENIWGDTPIRAMAAGEARVMTIVVAGPQRVRRIPAFCRLEFMLHVHHMDRGISLAKMHWDGKQVLPGPPPSLARERPAGRSATVRVGSVTKDSDVLPMIGSAAAGPYYLSVNYFVTPLRALGESRLRIVGDCTFPDGSRRQDQIGASSIRLDGGEVAGHSPLFMGSHIEVLPKRCDLVFELHRSSVAEPYPELLARVQVEPTEAAHP